MQLTCTDIITAQSAEELEAAKTMKAICQTWQGTGGVN